MAEATIAQALGKSVLMFSGGCPRPPATQRRCSRPAISTNDRGAAAANTSVGSRICYTDTGRANKRRAKSLELKKAKPYGPAFAQVGQGRQIADDRVRAAFALFKDPE